MVSENNHSIININKFEQGIMVYGAIGYKYKSKLFVCEKMVDGIEYLRLINDK